MNSRVKSMMKHVPSLVLQRVAKNEEWSLPEMQSAEGVVMLMNIEGLVEVNEACARMGNKGLSELVFSVNRYMEGVVAILDRYGGELIDFLGDRMLIAWSKEDEELQPTVQRALQCALKIKAEFAGKRIVKGSSLFSLSISIGVGQYNLAYLGVPHHVKYLILGNALMQAFEFNEPAGDKVTVSKECWELAQEAFKGKLIERTGGYEITGIKDPNFRIGAVRRKSFK